MEDDKQLYEKISPEDEIDLLELAFEDAAITPDELADLLQS